MKSRVTAGVCICTVLLFGCRNEAPYADGSPNPRGEMYVIAVHGEHGFHPNITLAPGLTEVPSDAAGPGEDGLFRVHCPLNAEGVTIFHQGLHVGMIEMRDLSPNRTNVVVVNNPPFRITAQHQRGG